ncbi:MAG: hypothetical protein E3J66_05850 [Dehalococcoidia bacterium]|nr:MAG: hypothetical protein E3J66_05850 [Dehalococcoidia bacterium]
MKVWADESRNDAILGPLIVDIDNESEDLSDALVVTKKTLEYLRSSYNIRDNDIHIFFTGHKGFNLEIHPEAVDIRGTQEKRENRAEHLRKEIIKNLQQGQNVGSDCSATTNLVSQRGTIIDRVYDYVRLHRSFNKWVSLNGEIARMKIELFINELDSLTIEKIIAKSESN